MAIYTVSIIGNYFVMVSSDSAELTIESPKALVSITPASTDEENMEFDIESPKMPGGVLRIPLNQLKDENGDAFTVESWQDFYRKNTGFNPASGGSGALAATGEMEFVLDGVQTVFNIPHGLDTAPNSIGLTFSDGRIDDFIRSDRSFDGANIIITCDSAPPVGTISVFWQAYN